MCADGTWEAVSNEANIDSYAAITRNLAAAREDEPGIFCCPILPLMSKTLAFLLSLYLLWRL